MTDTFGGTGGGATGAGSLETLNASRALRGDPPISLADYEGHITGPAYATMEPDAQAWDAGTLYPARAAVRHADALWVSAQATQGTEPGTNAAVWMLQLEGVNPQAIYDEAQGIADAGVAAAAAQTALAQGSAAVAQTAETGAVAARAAAEVARDAAQVGANIYASTAAGLAATAEGGQFMVASGSYIYRYRHDAGAIATEVARYPSAELVDGKLTVRQEASRVWTHVFRDAVKRAVFGFTTAGRIFARGVDVTDALSAEGVERNRLAGRIAEGYPRSKYTHGWRDSAGRVGLGLTRAGRLMLAGVDITDNLDGTLPVRVAAVESVLVSGGSVICWGDSLTEGAGSTGGQTYPVQLSALLGATVTNLGKGSQTADQITARTGARAALLTVTGDEIPASGAVAVTARSIDLCYYAGASLSVQGWLAGVFGTLTKVTSAGASSPLVSYTFTRAEAGAAVPCLPGTPFIPSAVYPDRTHVIWIGRNDYSGVTDAGALVAVNDRIKTNIAAIIGAMSTVGKRVIILGVTAKASADEYVGTGNFNAKRDLAADLARDYPRSFIDIDAILRRNGDSSPSDDADIANGVVPGSLRHDPVHLNNSGYAIVANAIADRMTNNGWI